MGEEEKEEGCSKNLRQAPAVGYSRPHLSSYYSLWIPLLPGSTFIPDRQRGEGEETWTWALKSIWIDSTNKRHVILK